MKKKRLGSAGGPGRVFGALLALAAAAGFVTSPRAAAQVADAVVEVTVVDDAGVAMPGVTIEVRRAETGFVRAATSDVRGGARFPNLAPASYAVKATLSGFSPIEETIVLRVGQTAKVKMGLRAARTESVTVTGEVPLVDVFKSDSSTNIVPEQIQALPVLDRDFQKLAFIAPGVQRERGAFRFISGGPVIGAGGNASQSTILVDGVDFTDPTLGLAKTRFSQDAISEFRVVQNRFDTEVGGSAGGALSIITRSGTNDFKGTVFGFYRADGLRAKGALEQESSADLYKGQFGLTLGGPIVKDQTHFFASLEQVTASSPILFRPGGAYASLAADLGHPYHQTLAFVGLDQRLSDTGNLSAKLDYERYRENNFRVGGVVDVSSGQELNRDNLNLALGFVQALGSTATNELRGQIGKRKYQEPPATSGPSQWFTGGVTLQRGGSIYGDLLGEGTQWELKDSISKQLVGSSGSHDLKLGVGVQRVVDTSRIDTYATGLLYYATDSAAAPALYLYGQGSSEVTANTTKLSAFLQDAWRPLSNLSVTAGVRYDFDSNGNNPDFTHPLVPEARGRDTNNIQPRLSLSWDVTNDGQNVVRGGAGIFTGRYLLLPAEQELALNGVTGRKLRTRVALPGLPIDPSNPENTGFLLPTIDIALIDTELVAPEATQATIGFTRKLGNTGLYADLEAIYVKGRNEITIRDKNWKGNVTGGRFYAQYGQVNTYTNDGRSEYKALVFSVNGSLKGGHVVTASLTAGSKRNVSDDFSPEFPTGYPNDPADIEAEYGRGRSSERLHLVMSGVIRAPWGITVAPIYEYGSGQPFTHRLGYDYNGDGKNSDRPAGVDRFGEDGPPFRQLSLRIAKSVAFGSGPSLELMVEGFNLFNTVNYDVTSVDGAEFFSGPTLANKNLAYVRNPNFGRFNATLPGREIQLGLRLSF